MTDRERKAFHALLEAVGRRPWFRGLVLHDGSLVAYCERSASHVPLGPAGLPRRLDEYPEIPIEFNWA